MTLALLVLLREGPPTSSIDRPGCHHAVMRTLPSFALVIPAKRAGLFLLLPPDGDETFVLSRVGPKGKQPPVCRLLGTLARTCRQTAPYFPG